MFYCESQYPVPLLDTGDNRSAWNRKDMKASSLDIRTIWLPIASTLGALFALTALLTSPGSIPGL